MKLGITMLIHNKDDIKFVTEFPCFLGHPVYYMKRWKNTFVLPIFCITNPEYMYATFLHHIVMESVFEWNPVCKAYIIWWKGWPGRSLLHYISYSLSEGFVHKGSATKLLFDYYLYKRNQGDWIRGNCSAAGNLDIFLYM